jgi:hypothetical protein
LNRRKPAGQRSDARNPDATSDLIDQIYVREVIEQGLADSKAGRTTDVQEVRRKYGLEQAVIHGAQNIGQPP